MTNKEKWLSSYIASQIFLLCLTVLYTLFYTNSALNDAFIRVSGGSGICSVEVFLLVLVWNVIVAPVLFRLILLFLEALYSEDDEAESEDTK